MKGGIYSDEKCPVCGSSFVDNHKDALICPKHPNIRATTQRVKFGKTKRRFKEDYKGASRFLTGLRFKTDEQTFDERDYQKSDPNTKG